MPPVRKEEGRKADRVLLRESGITFLAPWSPRGDCPVDAFLRSLKRAEYARFVHLAKTLAADRDYQRHERWKRVEGERFQEYKDFKIRIMGYRTGPDTWVFFYAFRKNATKLPQKHLEAARRHYLAHLDQGRKSDVHSET